MGCRSECTTPGILQLRVPSQGAPQPGCPEVTSRCQSPGFLSLSHPLLRMALAGTAPPQASNPTLRLCCGRILWAAPRKGWLI